LLLAVLARVDRPCSLNGDIGHVQVIPDLLQPHLRSSHLCLDFSKHSPLRLLELQMAFEAILPAGLQMISNLLASLGHHSQLLIHLLQSVILTLVIDDLLCGF
jgi:hypothetical protein